MRNLQRGWRALTATAVLATLAVAGRASAQTLPSEPLTVGDWLAIGGDFSGTFSCADAPPENGGACGDDAGFFNYTDYERSAVRMFRVDLAASVKATERVSILGELRSENVAAPLPYALYVRVRPWLAHEFDIQVGRVPPTFGSFSRRTYASDNPLIGYPLAYQYLTSLRPDSLPRDADELLRMRGRGWLSTFSVGNSYAEHGMPLVSALRWDTGVQAHGRRGAVTAAAAITTGTLGNPLVRDDNGGKQVAGRVLVEPTVGLKVGVSGARGQFIGDEAAQASGRDGDGGQFTQSAWGADVEYSRGHYLVRFEGILSRWRVPLSDPPGRELSLGARSTSIEGRYKLWPGLYVAARLDDLDFTTVATPTRRDAWDAPVRRIEFGGGYSLQRNLLAKVAFQRNTRAGGRVPAINLGAAQIVYWF